jgi:RimJ/RimL family protein N-acetyltransferase
MRTDFLHLSEQLERTHSDRLALRQVALADAWPLFQATRNPLFNQHLLWDQPTDQTQVNQRIDSIVSAARRGRLAAMSAVVKLTGEWVSLYRFQPYAVNPDWVEMGLWTHDRFWQGRYSLELSQACVDAAFALSDVNTLVAGAFPENAGSCRVLEHCGLSPGRQVIRHTEPGTEVLLTEYKITREDWIAQRKPERFKTIPSSGEHEHRAEGSYVRAPANVTA